MWRLVLTLSGITMIAGAMAMMWVISPLGRGVLGGGVGDVAPRDVAAAFTSLFTIGFLLASGALLQSTLGKVGSTLGGGTVSKADAHASAHESLALPMRVAWGLPAYLAAAASFGWYVAQLAHRHSDVFSAFSDSSFLVTAGTWPYHLMAMAAPWGLSPEKFY